MVDFTNSKETPAKGDSTFSFAKLYSGLNAPLPKYTHENPQIQAIANSYFKQNTGLESSVAAYHTQWDDYFASVYKNSQIAESNEGASQQGSGLKSTQGLNIASKNLVAKTVGTGIAGTSAINPFGTLDSGLGI